MDMDAYLALERKLKKNAVFWGQATAGIVAGEGVLNTAMYLLGSPIVYFDRAVQAAQEVLKGYWPSVGTAAALNVVVLPAILGAAAYGILYKINVGDKEFLKSLFE